MTLCNECVIAVHSNHIDAASHPIDKALFLKGKEIESLDYKIKSLYEKFRARDLKNKQPPIINKISQKSQDFINQLEIVKENINKLINEENVYLANVKKVCEEFYNRKMGYQIRKFEESTNDIVKLISLLHEDWNSQNDLTRLDLAKEGMIESLTEEYLDLNEIFEKIKVDRIDLFVHMDRCLSKLEMKNDLEALKFKDLMNCLDELNFIVKKEGKELSLNLFLNEVNLYDENDEPSLKEIQRMKNTDFIEALKKSHEYSKNSQRKKMNKINSKVIFRWKETCEICHDYGDLLHCEKCPKVAHLECMKLERAPEYFLCEKCQKLNIKNRNSKA